MITLKIKYNTSDDNITVIKEYQRQYTICYKVIYKYSKLGLSKKDIKEKLKLYKNIDLILNNSWFLNCLFFDVKSVLTKDCNVCFNKSLIIKRIKHLITKNVFKDKKYFKICSNGEKDKRCNRFFKIENVNTVLFKPNKDTKIYLNLQSIGKNRIKLINHLIRVQELNNELPITYKLDNQYIYICLDETYFKCMSFKPKQNRIFSIDLNPNYIGYSVLDWKDTEALKYKIIDSGIISLKSLNDKFFSMKNRGISSQDTIKLKLTNKRKFEVYEVSKYLVNIAKHYKCELFAMEDLSIKSSDKGNGKKYNSLCNNLWNRDKLENNIQKRCNILGIKLQKVIANWSSVLGNCLYRETNLPDMVLSSIEISRRAQEYNLQYLKKIKEITKNIVFPKLTEKVKKIISQTMEELNIIFDFDKLSEFCYFIKKNLKNKYRVPLDSSKVFRQKHWKYQLIVFNNC